MCPVQCYLCLRPLKGLERLPLSEEAAARRSSDILSRVNPL